MSAPATTTADAASPPLGVRRSARANKGRNSRLEAEIEAQNQAAEVSTVTRAVTQGRSRKRTTATGASSGAKRAKKVQQDETEPVEENEDDGEVNCICKKDENESDPTEEEKLWIECEKCLKWQHAECMLDVNTAEKIPSPYNCYQCDPELNANLIQQGKLSPTSIQPKKEEVSEKNEGDIVVEKKNDQMKPTETLKQNTQEEGTQEEEIQLTHEEELHQDMEKDEQYKDEDEDDEEYKAPQDEAEDAEFTDETVKTKTPRTAAKVTPVIKVPNNKSSKTLARTFAPLPDLGLDTGAGVVPRISLIKDKVRKSVATALCSIFKSIEEEEQVPKALKPSAAASSPENILTQPTENPIENKNIPGSESSTTPTPVSSPMTSSSSGSASEPSTAEVRALEIENALFQALAPRFGGDVGAKYREKFRSLSFNLRDTKNAVLRHRILHRELSDHQIVTLSNSEMMNPDLKALAAVVHAESIRESVLVMEEGPRIRRTHKGEEVVGGEDEDYQMSIDAFNSAENQDRESEEDNENKDNMDNISSNGSNSSRSNSKNINNVSYESEGDKEEPTLGKTSHSWGTDVHNNGVRPVDNHNDFDFALSPHDDDDNDHIDKSDNMGHGHDDSLDNDHGDFESDHELNELLNDDDDTGNNVKNKKAGSSALPTIFQGLVSMTGIVEFPSIGKHLGESSNTVITSPADTWTHVFDIQNPLIVDGRLDSNKADKYLASIAQTGRADSKKILMAFLVETNRSSNEGDDRDARFERLFEYFSSRGKYGVIKSRNVAFVKDAYIMPIKGNKSNNEEIPEFFNTMLTPEGISVHKYLRSQSRDMIVALFVVTKTVTTIASPSTQATQATQATVSTTTTSTATPITSALSTATSFSGNPLSGLGLSTNDIELLQNIIQAHPAIANNPEMLANPQVLLTLIQSHQGGGQHQDSNHHHQQPSNQQDQGYYPHRY
ncbi:hypothetical protein NADFUDRAFT_71001 [Nadsonia fulvescens var. elongata DSM 6958]|uniref:Transcription factor BYE1 n=1 Tax=Nadsonia fulvescens var. elongata DSM 6958 TaxID=857566 RepID=A0A1E3PH24_9ASCO|nr:hypothetical protein NADFUDRAFT_71001 [Nadsonia fulvescens var. elongata DSM 6958]